MAATSPLKKQPSRGVPDRVADCPAVHYVIPDIDLYEFQDDLPRLPVAELRASFDK